MGINKKIKFVVWGFVLIACVGACASSRYYKMTTRIHKNGSCERIAHGKAFPTFFTGDTSQNPFWFTLTPAWKIEQLDSALLDSMLNAEVIGLMEIKAKQRFKNISDYSATLQCDEVISPLLKPVESLKKQFRWFYTDYFFTARYINISDKLPVLPEQYMTEEERKLWFQGDMSNYKGLTGWNLKNELDVIEKKFNLFIARNLYEKIWETISYIEQKTSDTTYLSQMNLVKDTLFLLYAEEIEENKNADIKPEYMCSLLDNYLKTNYFIELYEANEAEIEQMYKQKMDFLDLFFNNFQYDLIMPGKVTYANTSFDASDTLRWEVEATLFLADDYALEAQSRSVNIWAFVLTFLLGILAVLGLLKWIRILTI